MNEIINNSELESAILQGDEEKVCEITKHMISGIIAKRKWWQWQEDLMQDNFEKIIELIREKKWLPERGRAFSFFNRIIINHSGNCIQKYVRQNKYKKELERAINEGRIIDGTLTPVCENDKKDNNMNNNKQYEKCANIVSQYDNIRGKINTQKFNQIVNKFISETNNLPINFLLDILTKEQLFQLLVIYGGTKINIPSIKKLMKND